VCTGAGVVFGAGFGGAGFGGAGLVGGGAAGVCSTVVVVGVVAGATYGCV
jgi:hypothetical protein